MKCAFVIGFMHEVEGSIRARFGRQLGEGALHVLSRDRVDIRRPPDLGRFKSELGRCVAQMSTENLDVLILCGDRKDWVSDAIRGVISQYEGIVTITCSFTPDLRTAEPLLKALSDFGLADETLLDMPPGVLLTYLGGRRVLCVRARHMPSYAAVLVRCGFPESVVREHFDEKDYTEGKNSNLIRDLYAATARYGSTLYAWKGLRYLPSELRRSGVVDGPTPVDVALKFKAKVLEGS